jgi:hypothetical protein
MVYVPDVVVPGFIAPVEASMVTPAGAEKVPPLSPVITGNMEPLLLQTGEAE